ncbi:MAG: DNA-directed RNA polymerase subunit D [Candidatus Aenigmatarchaeota archaeon]
MKVKILERKGPVLRFLLEGTDPAFANSLRRIMITEVPTLAVQWADFHENNSAMFDEILAHRLGLVPLKFNPKKFVFTQDCDCEGKGCPSCQVTLALEKHGPCIVTAGDMKSSDKSVSPADPRVPLVELLENQGVKFTAVARLGLGIDNARHHAAMASFQYYPEIKAGSKAEFQKAVRACPKGIVEYKGGKLSITDPARCDLCRKCMEEAKDVTLAADEKRIIFSVDSVSGLEPEYIVSAAAAILEKKAEGFKKELSALALK